MSRSLRTSVRRLAPSLVTAALVAACGGGGGGGGPGDTGPAPAPLPDALTGNPPPPTDMQCVGGQAFTVVNATTIQCSGNSILRTDNGVSITRSGVQAYAISTSNLLTPNPDVTSATGMRLATGTAAGTGSAELRIGKAANGSVTRAALLLSNLGVKWDGINERPIIIETFEPSQGVTQVDGAGSISLNTALPPPTNITYYDYNDNTFLGTQANYANNRYFPRTSPPLRCPGGGTTCASTETTGVSFVAGAGSDPSRTTAHRRHSDGDIHAGPQGPGVPFAGNKGSRDITNFNYQYSNIAAWIARETTLVDEWTPSTVSGTEHAMNRYGTAAFGATTAAASVPTTGTTIYRGTVYGYYSPNGDATGAQAQLLPFRANVVMEANFGTRQVLVGVSGATVDGAATPVPVTIGANAGIGAAGSNVANYATGAIADGGSGMSGGMSARIFGPAADEIAGTFVLQNATSKAVAIGGFIGRK